MAGTEFFDYQGRMWSVISLRTDSVLDYDSRLKLWGHVLDRYYDFQSNGSRELKKGVVKVVEDEFEAQIKSDGKYMTIGCLGGRIFEGVVESQKGKSNMSFLVCEPIEAGLN